MSLFDPAPPVRSTVRVIAFDIEIANEFELQPGEDLDRYAPFDISVAASTTREGSVRHWFAKDHSGRTARHLDAQLAREVLAFLRSEQEAGSIVTAWNGMAFDVRWLGHVAGDAALAAEVALDLYDPMFQFVSKRGFPISLAAVADGLGIVETKLMAGADAPREWALGNHQKVFDYVAGDCRLAREVVERLLVRREVRWRTKKGTVSSESFVKLERVRDVLRAPPPDQSWMSDPKPWETWFAWLAPFTR